MRISRIVLWTALGLVVAAAAGFAVLAYQPEMAAVARPDPGSFDKALVERGRVLANYGDCTACHTRPDGPPFAGNFPIKTPFGTIYTSNITPDTETGIGTWSKEAFRRSMKDGVNRKGHHLYPAFPYDQFTKVRDADIDAIYAYLMAAVAPVRETTRDNDFGFPFNIRATLAVWKALFLDKTPFQPDPSKDAAWNEGAYLVEGLGHCAACHSPRNFMGARTTPAYGGGSAEGWYAPPLNKDNLSQQPWTKLELVTYLMDGWQPKHGMAAGPMTPVVDALHKQNEIDVFAIAAYVEHAARRRETDRSGRRQGRGAPARVGQPARAAGAEGIQRGRQGVRGALRAMPSQQWRHRAAGAAKLDPRAGPRQRRRGHPQRHQAADRRARPLDAGVRVAAVGRGDQRAGEIPARTLQHAGAVENLGIGRLHARR